MEWIQKALLVLIVCIGSVFGAFDEESVGASKLESKLNLDRKTFEDTYIDQGNSLKTSCDYGVREARSRVVIVTQWESLFGVKSDLEVKMALRTVYEAHKEIPEVDFLFFYIVGLEKKSGAYTQIKNLGAVNEEEAETVSQNFELNIDAVTPKNLRDDQVCLLLHKSKLYEQE
ncbi:MAG: hypothetical protein ACK5PQ_04720 [Alphaproteobacteria bacterium]